jgi:hypothetical protein
MAGNLTGRRARLAMADMRALEEGAERVNPVGKGRGKKGGMAGCGATPSMGLSEFRGGRSGSFDMMDLMPSGEYDGAGKHSLMDHMAHPTKGFGKLLGEKGHGLRGGAETGAYQGEGKLHIIHGGAHDMDRMVGSGAGPAAPVKVKRVVSADDPRRRRAQLVGQVMKERGCSLAEASKAVKAEGLEY